MRLIPIVPVAMLLLGATTEVFADPVPPRVPVNVRLVGDDGLTQKLSASLKEGLRKHKHLMLANGDDRAVLTIRSETNVDWTTLDNRNVVIYLVWIDRDGGSQPITGACYERAMAKCVKEILRVADIRSGPR